mgnify:CR=1 FL=1
MKGLALLSIALTACAPIFAQAAKPEASPQRRASLSIFEENDFRFSDRYYTNGFKATYTDPGDDWWSSRLQFMALRLFADSPGAQASQTASFGQDMYVGYDISIPNPPEGDRPYAGWLYLSSGAHIATKNSLDSLTVSLGIVGPQSYAGDTQKAYHEIIGDDRPRGWDTQIKNEPGIIIAYNHSQRLFRTDLGGGFSADFIGSLGANLGNVSTEGRAKVLARFGFNLPYSFEAARIEAASGQDVEWAGPCGRPDWHLFLYFGGVGRLVGYDITLDGNTFADSRSVAKKWLVGETNLGVSARYGRVELNLNWVVRSEEFNTQRYGAHMFWAASAKYMF